MNSRSIKYAIGAVAVAIAAYWYWSPLLAVHQMQSAAKAGDADAFNDHVDYPRLRESLKGQLSAAFMSRMASQPEETNDFAKAGAALGSALGMAMVDRLVDAFVRPETVMRAMQDGKLAPKKATDEAVGGPPGATGDEKPNLQSERKSIDKYIVYMSKPGEPEDQRIALVMERSGFANWKLTEVRLPAMR